MSTGLVLGYMLWELLLNLRFLSDENVILKDTSLLHGLHNDATFPSVITALIERILTKFDRQAYNIFSMLIDNLVFQKCVSVESR
jgi:hypothetical protein